MAPLLVLWILSERSSYGYEIKRSLTDGGMGFWFGLADASVYSALRTLAKNGHVRQVGTEQPGARPPRTRYAITAAGRRHYRGLLADAAATVRLPVAPIDVVLSARGDLDAAAISESLAERTKSLHELRDEVESHRSAAPSAALVDRNLAHIDAELAWLEQLDQSQIA